jgi:hypothetical protein
MNLRRWQFARRYSLVDPGNFDGVVVTACTVRASRSTSLRSSALAGVT